MPINSRANNTSIPRLGWILWLCYLACVPLQAQTPAPRVITLAPHLTELAYATGLEAHLVGVVAYSDYPPTAKMLPIIGDAFRFDMEKIVSLQATTALAWSGGTPWAVADQLKSLGVEVIWIETRTLDQIAKALVTMGQLLEDPTDALIAAQKFGQTIEHHRNQRDHFDHANAVSIFYQISERPLYTFGGRHVINEVFELCGATNVFSDMDIEALQVDKEAVIARAPDMILVGVDTQSGLDQSTDLLHWTSQHPSLEGIKLHALDANLLVRPTPRIVEGIEALCALTNNIQTP